MYFHINISCDTTLEPSHRDGSNEVSQHMLSLRSKKNYLKKILKTPSYVKLSCGSLYQGIYL